MLSALPLLQLRFNIFAFIMGVRAEVFDPIPGIWPMPVFGGGGAYTHGFATPPSPPLRFPASTLGAPHQKLMAFST